MEFKEIIFDDTKIKISKCGNVIYVNYRLRKVVCKKNKYHQIRINKKNYRTHRLIALAWIPNPENKPEINHKDGDKSNNHVDNLEWATRSENIKHAFDYNLKNAEGGNNGYSKLTEKQVYNIVEKYNTGNYTYKDLSSMFNISTIVISKIITRTLWTHLDLSINKDVKIANYFKYQVRSKLKEYQVLKIRELYATGNYSQTQLSKMYNVGQHSISSIVRRKSWKHI